MKRLTEEFHKDYDEPGFYRQVIRLAYQRLILGLMMTAAGHLRNQVPNIF